MDGTREAHTDEGEPIRSADVPSRAPAGGTALLLGEVIEADDRYTGFHSRQVADLAIALADAVGLDGSQRRNIEFTAPVHDVGKIHVPDEILDKPGKLDEQEWSVIRRHTIDGERSAEAGVGALANIGEFVRASSDPMARASRAVASAGRLAHAQRIAQ